MRRRHRRHGSSSSCAIVLLTRKVSAEHPDCALMRINHAPTEFGRTWSLDLNQRTAVGAG